MKNPVEVQLPAPNCFLIILCMEQSGDQIPPTLLDDFFLNLRYGPAIEGDEWIVHNMYSGFGSPLQLLDRIAHGLTNVVQRLSFHPPVEGFTDIGAG